jgi:hypothetical protein
MLALDITPIEPSDCTELPGDAFECRINLLTKENVYLSDVFFEADSTAEVEISTIGLTHNDSEIVLDSAVIYPGEEYRALVRCSKNDQIDRIRLVPSVPGAITISDLRFRQLHR